MMNNNNNWEEISNEMINEIWTANNIGDEGARMISEALKINSTLTKLNLRCDEK